MRYMPRWWSAAESALRSSGEPKCELVDVMSFGQYLLRISTQSRRSAPHAPVERLALLAGALKVGDDGRDPDGVEAHALDVVEVVRDPLPAAAAVLAVARAAGRARVVREREAVRDELRGRRQRANKSRGARGDERSDAWGRERTW
jgi:hypothetical protein